MGPIASDWVLRFGLHNAHVQISVTQGPSHNYQYHSRNEVVDKEAGVEVRATEHSCQLPNHRLWPRRVVQLGPNIQLPEL
jgi:hypothetical protein